jgi:hypothetical protein
VENYKIVYHNNPKNVDDLLNSLSIKVKDYFDNLTVLSNYTYSAIQTILNKINKKFSNCKVNIASNYFLEDIFEIEIKEDYTLKSYLISDNGLLKWRNDKDPLISDIKEIETFIIKDIEVVILKYFSKKCSDCGESILLNIGELQFFVKKGFQLPKRCKCCRDKRKQNK